MGGFVGGFWHETLPQPFTMGGHTHSLTHRHTLTHSNTHARAGSLFTDLVDSGSCSGVKGDNGLGFGAAMISHVIQLVCFYFLSVQETQKYP